MKRLFNGLVLVVLAIALVAPLTGCSNKKPAAGGSSATGGASGAGTTGGATEEKK